jgi:methionyl-tRNA formyltransferase
LNFLIGGKNEALELAVRTLTKLDADLKLSVVLSCDDFNGRNQKVITFCKTKNIPLYSVDNRAQLVQLSKELKFEIFLSTQFPVILDYKFIESLKGNCYNIHFSNLPKYRGMAPITHAIRNGEKEFGTTLHVIDAGIDTGPIIDIEKFQISGLSNYQIYDISVANTSKLIERNYLQLIRNRSGDDFPLYQQNDYDASYYPKDEGLYSNNQIHFRQPAIGVVRHYLAMDFRPYYHASTFVDNNRVNIIERPEILDRCIGLKPGTIVARENGWFIVSTLDRLVRIRYIYA